LVEGPNTPATPYVVNAALSAAALQITNSANGAALHIGAGSQDALVVDGSSKFADIDANDLMASTIGNSTRFFADTGIFGSGKDMGVQGEGVHIGVHGSGSIGVRATTNSIVAGAGIGLEASGVFAHAQFPFSGSLPWKRVIGPGQTPAVFAGGELIVDSTGTWWACVKSGATSDSWRMLAAPESSGSFVPIVPQRFYDSRISGNLLKADTERVIDLPATLPDGVRAVHVNVTVCNTVGAGYLAIFPTGTLWPGTSTVNWFADNQFVANAITVMTDGKHLTLRAGTNATNIVLDLYGYYR